MSHYRLASVILGVTALVGLGAVAASGVTDNQSSPPEGTGIPQFTGPAPEIVPIGSAPTALKRSQWEAADEFRGSARGERAIALVAESSATGFPQFTGPPPDIVPVGSTPPSAKDGGVSAQSTFFSCNQNGLCLWQHVDYSGNFWLLDKDVYTWNAWHPVPGPADNRTSSMYNRRAKVTLVSRIFPPTQPDIVCLPAQAAYDNLTNWAWPSGTNANDTISGFDFLNASTC
jgi:hypothetical protein